MRLFLFCCLTVGIVAQFCEPGWTLFNNNCYKYYHNRNDTGTVGGVKSICSKQGAQIASGDTKEEVAFLTEQARPDVEADTETPYLGDWINLYGVYKATLVLGLTRVGNSWTGWQNEDGQIVTPNLLFCPGFGNAKLADICAHMYQRTKNQPSCIDDIECDAYNQWLFRYACKRKTCPAQGQVAWNGVCQCSKGYIKRSRTGGLDCVSATPCHQVTSSLSILFIVDSSASIGERNWDSLIRFLKSGAQLIPNTARVGFIKYAFNVTYAKWVEPGWTEAEFNRRVPYRYDEGETNTAEALRTAANMMKHDNSRSQVAVLVTDGLPYTEEYKDDKEGALAVTKQEAKELGRVATLVTLGYGAALQQQNGESYLRKLVQGDKEDYFSFRSDAHELEESHMSILLGKVCNRFVRR